MVDGQIRDYSKRVQSWRIKPLLTEAVQAGRALEKAMPDRLILRGRFE
jgi:hypothetical protein